VPRPPPTEGAPLGRPLFLLNLKAYPGTGGDGALRLARLLEERTRALGVAGAIAPASADIGRVAAESDLSVVAQHVDPGLPGARTGFLVPESAAASGARGSLVNHSEHPLSSALVARTVTRLGEAGLTAVVCAGTVRKAGTLARTRPPYLAIEPPELIGGKVSVSTARPEVIAGTVRVIQAQSPGTLVLCGAGIHDRRDVRKALELGSHGVLVASAVATAKDPRAAIDELLAGF
jgi:triosephosphate isomerase (TIM)